MIKTRLVELRNKRGLTQAQIAQHLNISYQAYSLYETNKRQMNYTTLCLLADFFEVSIGYLLGHEDTAPSFLDDEERGIIERFRGLDRRGKESVMALLDYEYRLSYKQKKLTV